MIDYTLGKQIVLLPKTRIPLSKKEKALARHDCPDILIPWDVGEMSEKCLVMLITRV